MRTGHSVPLAGLVRFSVALVPTLPGRAGCRGSCLPWLSDKGCCGHTRLWISLCIQWAYFREAFTLEKTTDLFLFLNLSVLHTSLLKYLLYDLAGWNVFIEITDFVMWFQC